MSETIEKNEDEEKGGLTPGSLTIENGLAPKQHSVIHCWRTYGKMERQVVER